MNEMNKSRYRRGGVIWTNQRFSRRLTSKPIGGITPLVR
jgi:hypothetical protein